MADENQNLSKDSEQIVQRDEHGRLLPGSILNPKGTKIGTKHLSTLLWNSLKEKVKDKNGNEMTLEDALTKVIRNEILKGNLKAVEMVFDRFEGKPRQSLHVTEDPEQTSPEFKEKVNDAIGEFLNDNTRNTGK